MTRGQDYAQKVYFVNSVLKKLLEVKTDFEYIKYARQNVTNSEFIRIGDIKGSAITLDVTGKSLEEIVDDIARVILVGTERIAPPSGIVVDVNKLRSLASLFR